MLRKQIITCILIAALQLTILSVPKALGQENQEYANLSLKKSTTASSTLKTFTAQKSTDDKLDTGWSPTPEDSINRPWIQVDLGATYIIKKIELVTRQDIDQPDTRKNFEVQGSNDIEFFDYQILGSHGEKALDFKAVWSQEIDDSNGYRFIRIRKSKPEYFFLAELRVFGESGIPKTSEKSYEATDYAHHEAAEALIALNAFDKGTDLSESVTRASFVSQLLELSGLSFEHSVENLPFSDVDNQHPCFFQLSLAKEIGIIKGDENNRFNPDEIITIEHAFTVILSLLGYGPYAEKLGNYPFNYLTLAYSNKLNRQLDLNIGSPLNYGHMAQLFYNTFDVKVMEQTAYESTRTYTTKNNHTFLSYFLNITKEFGVVTGELGASLKDLTFPLESEIEIDNEVFKKSDGLLVDALGLMVEYWVKKDINEKTVIHLTPSTQNTIYHVDSSMLSQIQDSSKYTLDFYPEDDSKIVRSLKISQTADVVVNGEPCPLYSKEDLRVCEGNIRLIDHNNDSFMDVVIIESYVDFHVSGIDYVNKKLYSNKDFVDLGDSLKQLLVRKNNKHFEFEKIQIGDVVSVALGANRSVAQLHVSRFKIRGEVFEISEEKILINQTEVTLSKWSTLDLILGQRGIFCFNWQGKLVALEEGKKDASKYGYLVAATETNGVDKAIQIKLFSQTGEMSVYYCDKSLKINGESVRSIERLKERLLDSAKIINPSAQNISQLIRYNTNFWDDIISIDVVDSHQNDSQNLRLSVRTNGAIFKRAMLVFDGRYSVDKNTIIMVVPDDFLRDDEYNVLTYADLRNDGEYNMHGYNASLVGVLDALVIQSGAPQVHADTRLSVVEKIVSGIDRDGMNTERLVVLEGGAIVKVDAEIPNMFSLKYKLTTGDVIRYTKLPNGKANYVQKVLNADESEGYDDTLAEVWGSAPFLGSIAGSYRITYGVPLVRDGSKILVSIGNDLTESSQQFFDLATATNIYEFDKKKKSVRVSNYNEIFDYESFGKDADKILLRTKYGELREVVIIRGSLN